MQDQSTPGEGSEGARLRSLETQTTIPLGHVDETGLDEAIRAKYDQPLWQCLFADNPNKEVEVESLITPTCAWLDARQDQNDIERVDPEMKLAFEKAMDLKQVSVDKEAEMNRQNDERTKSLAKIAAAADLMIQQQLMKVKDLGCEGPPEESPLFQVNKNNIDVWRANKGQIVEKGYQCAVDASRAADEAMKEHIRCMVETAFDDWVFRNKMTPEVGVDPDLFGELEAIMEAGPVTVTCLFYVGLSSGLYGGYRYNYIDLYIILCNPDSCLLFV